jgi:hypothetical protein
MDFTSFYVEHTNTVVQPNEQGELTAYEAKGDLNEKLGTGLCVGVIPTREGLKSLVIWEGQRFPSPSLHDPIELAWVAMFEKEDGFGLEEETEGTETETLETEGLEAVTETENLDGGDFEEEVTVLTNDANEDFTNDSTIVDAEVVNSETDTETQRV